MHKFTVVNFIDETSEGTEFAATDWPLHLTLADDFELVSNRTNLISALKDFAQSQKPLTVLAYEDDHLGKYGEALVTLIDTDMELIALHKELVQILKHYGAVFYNPHYIIGGYKPHVTVQKLGRIKPGELVKVDNLALVDMRPGGDEQRRRVIMSLSFGGQG